MKKSIEQIIDAFKILLKVRLDFQNALTASIRCSDFEATV
jgi:hypothetical protein